jgi:hypothetical protein
MSQAYNTFSFHPPLQPYDLASTQAQHLSSLPVADVTFDSLLDNKHPAGLFGAQEDFSSHSDIFSVPLQGDNITVR